jgi:hypothetical protein
MVWIIGEWAIGAIGAYEWIDLQYFETIGAWIDSEHLVMAETYPKTIAECGGRSGERQSEP